MPTEMMSSSTPKSTGRIEAILESVTERGASQPTSEAPGLTRWQTIRLASLVWSWIETVPGRAWDQAVNAWESICSYAQFDTLENMDTALIFGIAESAYAYGFYTGQQGKTLMDMADDAGKEEHTSLEPVHQQWALWLDHMAQEHPELRPQLVGLDDARQQMEKRLREDIFREAVLDGMALQKEALS
jgi:hypothetical protein